MTSLEYLTSKKITPVIRIVAGSNKAEAFVTMTIEQFEEYGKHCVEKPTTPKEIEDARKFIRECHADIGFMGSPEYYEKRKMIEDWDKKKEETK